MILGYISYRKWKSMTVAVFPFSSFLFKTWSIKWKRQSLSRVRLFGISWTVGHQAPLSVGFSRQEHWSGLPFSPPGDLPGPGMEPRSPALQADSVPSQPPGKALWVWGQRPGNGKHRVNWRFGNADIPRGLDFIKKVNSMHDSLSESGPLWEQKQSGSLCWT